MNVEDLNAEADRICAVWWRLLHKRINRENVKMNLIVIEKWKRRWDKTKESLSLEQHD